MTPDKAGAGCGLAFWEHCRLQRLVHAGRLPFDRVRGQLAATWAAMGGRRRIKALAYIEHLERKAAGRRAA